MATAASPDARTRPCRARGAFRGRLARMRAHRAASLRRARTVRASACTLRRGIRSRANRRNDRASPPLSL
ncbi:hypothetical protein BURPSS13_X0544 [Burkholderia pseudomallei S13]|nr:hypothetical protein BURPSS13_X0544 [Burkholderia pseudomallei S13]